MKRIALFNHKGGVSKTTSAYHLAWMLTKLGKRVLLVDADSQCNLSILCMGEEAFETYLDSNRDNTIKELLRPAFKAEPRPICANEAVPVRKNDLLFLIPGSFDLTEYEVSLGMSFGFNSSIGTLANLPGSFNYLFSEYESKYNIDFTIVDLNPSLSAINQTLLLTSDYFVVPTACDYFSKLAIRSLKTVLPQWETWAKTARTILADSSYPLKPETPKYLGAVVQGFSIRNGQPTQANQQIIDEILDEVRKNFIPALQTAGMIDARFPPDFAIQPSDFNTLNAVYHQNGVPVFEITEEMMTAAGWFGQTLVINKQKLLVFKQEYEKMAQRIIKYAV
jgi:chromosome partitioning protein